MDDTLTKEDYYNKYIDILNKYNELYAKFDKRHTIQKNACLKYFNNKKNQEQFCDICEINIKITSFKSHIKSQKHLKCVELQTKIKELQK